MKAPIIALDSKQFDFTLVTRVNFRMVGFQKSESEKKGKKQLV